MCWIRWCGGRTCTSDSGDVLHPLLVEREEKNVLVIVIAGDKGFAGAFNSNIGKAAQGFIDERRAMGQNVDLEPVGKKARDLYSKRYPTAVYEKTEEHYDNDLSTHYETIRQRAQPIEVAGEHPTMLLQLDFDEVSAMAARSSSGMSGRRSTRYTSSTTSSSR